MRLDRPLCCWTPAGEPVLLISKNDNGAGLVYDKGRVVRLSCSNLKKLMLHHASLPLQPPQHRSPDLVKRFWRLHRLSRDPVFLQWLCLEASGRFDEQLPWADLDPQASHLLLRAAALVAATSKPPRPPRPPRPGKPGHWRTKKAEINAAIDQLLAFVWSRQ